MTTTERPAPVIPQISGATEVWVKKRGDEKAVQTTLGEWAFDNGLTGKQIVLSATTWLEHHGHYYDGEEWQINLVSADTELLAHELRSMGYTGCGDAAGMMAIEPLLTADRYPLAEVRALKWQFRYVMEGMRWLFLGPGK